MVKGLDTVVDYVLVDLIKPRKGFQLTDKRKQLTYMKIFRWENSDQHGWQVSPNSLLTTFNLNPEDRDAVLKVKVGNLKKNLYSCSTWDLWGCFKRRHTLAKATLPVKGLLEGGHQLVDLTVVSDGLEAAKLDLGVLRDLALINPR